MDRVNFQFLKLETSSTNVNCLKLIRSRNSIFTKVVPKMPVYLVIGSFGQIFGWNGIHSDCVGFARSDVGNDLRSHGLILIVANFDSNNVIILLTLNLRWLWYFKNSPNSNSIGYFGAAKTTFRNAIWCWKKGSFLLHYFFLHQISFTRFLNWKEETFRIRASNE